MAEMTDEELAAIASRVQHATCELTNEYAVEHLGFRWWSWIGHPVKGTPGYPQIMRVRQLLSPEQLASKSWREFLDDPANEARPADGTEPLDYTYCSSGCTVVMPTRTVHAYDIVEQDVPRLLAEVQRLQSERRLAVDMLREIHRIINWHGHTTAIKKIDALIEDLSK